MNKVAGCHNNENEINEEQWWESKVNIEENVLN
jgi:hypothetical protein